jgi:hypothetical protein
MHREVTRSYVVRAAMSWLLAWAGCGGDSSQPEDDTSMAGAGSESSCKSAASAPTFTQVYEMMFPRSTNAHCSMCHGLPANDLSNGNLSIGPTQADAYAALVGKMSPMTSRCMPAPLVVPCKPDESLLLQKLTSTPPCGNQMPVGGAPFSEDQLDMVRGWIAAGAQDN